MRASIHKLVPYQHIFNKYHTSEDRDAIPYFMKSILNLKFPQKDPPSLPRFNPSDSGSSNSVTPPLSTNNRFKN
ncbi:hypothetical protein N9E34_06835 [Opitutales bacterium]|nr:hypothetical protein [Opitutales bacterium]